MDYNVGRNIKSENITQIILICILGEQQKVGKQGSDDS